MKSLKSAASLAFILAACLALLLPLALFSAPKDSEIGLFQIINEMQDTCRHVPVLNSQPVRVQNPLTITAMSLLPIIDISTPRLVSAFLGCVLLACLFLYCLALFDLSSAVVSTLIAMTSLGFLALFSTLNFAALPITLASTAFGLFSLVYIKRLHSGLYFISYILAGLAAVTGGWFMLMFFVFGALLLILLDLAPSEAFSIHLIPGLIIIACAMAAYFVVYRIILGPDFSGSAFSPGTHLGLLKGMYAMLTYSSPWIFLLVPAWIWGGGPSDRDTWRTWLPMRTALVLMFLMLWGSSSGLQPYAAVCALFASPMIGCWISQGLFKDSQKGSLGFWMMSLAGATVIITAIVLLLLPVYLGFALQMKQIMAAGALCVIALAFFILSLRRSTAGQFVVILLAVAAITWHLSFLDPGDQWDRKISYMHDISLNAPLIVYEDDLVMRGYMSAVIADPMVVTRNAVPLSERAFLAVSTSDLDALLEGLKGGMQPVLVDSYRAENTYALVMLSPRRHYQ